MRGFFSSFEELAGNANSEESNEPQRKRNGF